MQCNPQWWLLSHLSEKRNLDTIYVVTGFPRGAAGKEFVYQGRRWRRSGFYPWVGKIPCRRKWQPSPVFLAGKSHGQRSLVGCISWDRQERNMPAWDKTIGSEDQLTLRGLTAEALPVGLQWQTSWATGQEGYGGRPLPRAVAPKYWYFSIKLCFLDPVPIRKQRHLLRCCCWSDGLRQHDS